MPLTSASPIDKIARIAAVKIGDFKMASSTVVNSFNGRSGDVMPECGDYSDCYQPIVPGATAGNVAVFDGNGILIDGGVPPGGGGGNIELVRATSTGDWVVESASWLFMDFDRLDKETNSAIMKQDDLDSSKFIAVVGGYYEIYVSANVKENMNTSFFINGVLGDESQREIRLATAEATSVHIEFAGQLDAGDVLQFAYQKGNGVPNGYIFDFAKVMFKRMSD